MRTESELKAFVESLDTEAMTDYSNRLYDNLKELHNKEEKYTLWAIVIIFLYLILKNSDIGSLQIGPIGIKDISIISKILPLVFAYNLLNLYGIISQMTDVQLGLQILSEKRFNISTKQSSRNSIRESIISRIYYPHTIANTIVRIFQKKPSLTEILFGVIIFLPIILLAFIPHAIIILMLIDIFNNYCNDLFGKICFGLTLWTFIIIIFYLYRTSRDKMN